MVKKIPYGNLTDLSSGEIGLYGTMVELPEFDYVTPKEISNKLSKDNITDIKKWLSSLVEKNYLLTCAGKYAVNKDKLLSIFSGGVI